MSDLNFSPPAWARAMPADRGFNVTQKYYRAAEGPIDPSRVTLPSPFVVVVVGGSKGIGAAVAKAYAQAGASGIVVTSRRLGDLDGVVQEISDMRAMSTKGQGQGQGQAPAPAQAHAQGQAHSQAHFQVVPFAVDVTIQAQVLALRDMVDQTFGRLDVLVANAGVAPALLADNDNDTVTGTGTGTHFHFPSSVAAEDGADFARVLSANLVGSFLVANAFLPLLQRTRDGPQTIIFSSSASSLDRGSALVPSSYNISKLAVNRLAEHIHQDHYEADGVVAVALHPGCIQTPIAELYPAVWKEILTDDISLPGGVCVWLTAEKRGWLSGRYFCANWDVEELLARKKEIVEKDLFKMRLLL